MDIGVSPILNDEYANMGIWEYGNGMTNKGMTNMGMRVWVCVGDVILPNYV